MSNISNVGINMAEKATLIWNVADMLRGPFKPHEYGLVILPMTVVKRFHDCLLSTHNKVLETFEKVKITAFFIFAISSILICSLHLLTLL